LLLSEGQAGIGWEPANAVMPLLPQMEVSLISCFPLSSGLLLSYIFISVFLLPQQSRIGAIFEQDSECTYNVTLWRVRVTIVVVEKQ
jgi:hypothetical protein